VPIAAAAMSAAAAAAAVWLAFPDFDLVFNLSCTDE